MTRLSCSDPWVPGCGCHKRVGAQRAYGAARGMDDGHLPSVVGQLKPESRCPWRTLPSSHWFNPGVFQTMWSHLKRLCSSWPALQDRCTASRTQGTRGAGHQGVPEDGVRALPGDRSRHGPPRRDLPDRRRPPRQAVRAGTPTPGRLTRSKPRHCSSAQWVKALVQPGRRARCAKAPDGQFRTYTVTRTAARAGRRLCSVPTSTRRISQSCGPRTVAACTVDLA